MMTIDETLELSDKIYELSLEIENGFLDWDAHPNTYLLTRDHPVHDCISKLVLASASLKEYANGFKEMQYCK